MSSVQNYPDTATKQPTHGSVGDAMHHSGGPAAWPDWREGLSHPVILLSLRLIVGGVLLFAASQKIQAPKAFALSIGAFGMVPRTWIVPLAFLFVWQEIIAGAFLIAGIWSRAAAVVAGGLLLVFLFALGWAALRGLPIDCGCFGGLSAGSIGWSSLLRNLFLVSLAIWTAFQGGGRFAIEQFWSRSSIPNSSS